MFINDRFVRQVEKNNADAGDCRTLELPQTFPMLTSIFLFIFLVSSCNTIPGDLLSIPISPVEKSLGERHIYVIFLRAAISSRSFWGIHRLTSPGRFHNKLPRRTPSHNTKKSSLKHVTRVPVPHFYVLFFGANLGS